MRHRRVGRLALGLAFTVLVASVPASPAGAADRGPCGWRPAPPDHWDHVVWIWMENHTSDQVIGTSEAPYETRLAAECGTASDYEVVGSPSLPNYIAMTSGSTQGITDDSGPSSHPLNVPSIFSQLPAGASRSLEESMPSNCLLTDSGDYAVRHNPMAYYITIRTDCLTDDVPLGSTPNISARFTFVTPNLCNDTHDCSVATGDTWLSNFLPQILSSTQYQSGSTAVFITWDENDGSSGNHIATLVLSPTTPVDARSGTAYNHYALLRTTEELLGITTYLGGAATAPSMRAAFGL